MDRAPIVWLLPLVIMVLGTCAALDQAKITDLEGVITILPNMYSREEIRLTYQGVSGKILGDEFHVPGEVAGLKVADSLGSIPHSVKRVEGISVIRFYFRRPLRQGQTQTVTISYTSSNFTSKSGSTWSYSTRLVTRTPCDRWLVDLRIPGSVDIYLPSGGGLEGLKSITRGGGYTTCRWTASSTDNLAVAISYRPQEQNTRTSLLSLIAVAAVVVVALVSAYILRMLIPSRRVPKAVEIATRILEDRERRIVRELADGRKLTQAELVKAAKLSKATVSRAVVELERRRIVDRERSGRVVRVKLQDWIMES